MSERAPTVPRSNETIYHERVMSLKTNFRLIISKRLMMQASKVVVRTPLTNSRPIVSHVSLRDRMTDAVIINVFSTIIITVDNSVVHASSEISSRVHNTIITASAFRHINITRYYHYHVHGCWHRIVITTIIIRIVYLLCARNKCRLQWLNASGNGGDGRGGFVPMCA